MKRMLRLLALIALSALGACDLFGPSGPGDLTARVDAQDVDVGAAVLRVSGAGVKGFSPAGGSRVFSREQGDPGTWRVVVVNPDGGELLFRIEVEDVAAPAPSTLIFSAADTSDDALPAERNVRVIIDRE